MFEERNFSSMRVLLHVQAHQQHIALQQVMRRIVIRAGVAWYKHIKQAGYGVHGIQLRAQCRVGGGIVWMGGVGDALAQDEESVRDVAGDDECAGGGGRIDGVFEESCCDAAQRGGGGGRCCE
jgi:hypothetical protein